MQDGKTVRSGEPAHVTALRGLALRARDLAVLWLAFGVVVGACTTPAGGGWVCLVAGAIAGIIVLTPVGMVLSLIGARPRETMVCGLGGLALGALAGMAGSAEVGPAAAFGLVFGGMVGATFVAFFYRLPRLLLGRLAARA